MFEIIVGFLGFYCLTSYAQSTRLGYSGPISSGLSILLLPAAISVTWALFIAIGWWVAAVFVGASLAAGTANGLLQRRAGREGLIDAQPLRAIFFTLAAIGIWITRFQ